MLLAAVRDEFLERPWDPPAAHWPTDPSIVGGRDRVAGGTWLAVDPTGPAVAAVLNGVRLPPPASVPRPSRGGLPLAALTATVPASDEGYDGYQLVLATPSTVTIQTFDGVARTVQELAPGDHIIVNEGVDAVTDSLVPYFAPRFEALPDPPMHGGSTGDAWGAWVDLLRGDGLPVDDPRALLIRVEHEGRVYGSGSLALVGIAPDAVRYDFSPTPLAPTWSVVLPG